ncbi:MAG: hypothetical protein IID31_10075 [Planctomycetes bacterium]|nr:hypothetical protein [Planctomycetota bacterium]
MPLLACKLVHHTGTIIRFTTSQLPQLPSEDRDITVELPTGRIADGHFRRHPANPNVSGPNVVSYIKSHVGFGETARALIDATGYSWQLYTLDDAVEFAQRENMNTARVRAGRITGADLSRLLARADRQTQAGERRIAYTRLLRPSGLRRMILELMGKSCQVDGCAAVEDMEREWGDPRAGLAIVEVHHIEGLVRRVDHHPRNLSVVCGNHHRLIHGFRPWAIEHDGDDVVLTKGTRSVRIVRDLSFLD